MARELFLVAALAMLMAVIDGNRMQFTGRWNMQSKTAITPQNTRKSSNFRQLTSNSKSAKIAYGIPVTMPRYSVNKGQQPPNRQYTSNVKFSGSRLNRPPTTAKPYYKAVYKTGHATFRLSSYPRQAAVTLAVVRPTAHAKQAPSYAKLGFNARLHATKSNVRGANAPPPTPRQFSFSQGYVAKSPGPKRQAPPPRQPQPPPRYQPPPPRYNRPPPPLRNPAPPPRRMPPHPPRRNPPLPPPRQPQPQFQHPPPHPAPPRYNYMPPAPPQYHPRPHPPRPQPHYYHPPPPPPRYNPPYVFPTKKPVTPAPTPKPTPEPTTTTTTTTKKPIPETEVEVENGAGAPAQPLPQCDYWYIDPQGVYKWFPCQKQTFAPPPPTTTPMPLDLIFYDIQTVPPPEPVYIPVYYDYPDRKKEEESTK